VVPKKTKYKFIESLNQLICLILEIVLWYVPLGVCFLIMFYLGTAEDILTKLAQIGMFIVCVLSGLAFHGLVVLPVLYLIFVRKNPLRWYKIISPALLTAFGTSSSSATLPVTMEVLESAGVPSFLARFMLPLGATLNMDGGALYESVTAMFVMQTIGRDLNFGAVLLVFFCGNIGQHWNSRNSKRRDDLNNSGAYYIKLAS